MKKVLLSSIAAKQYNNLDKSNKTRIKKALVKLSETGKGDIKKLRGTKGRESLLRLRIGDYRIIYAEHDDEINIIQIIHRSKGYDWL